MNVPYLHACGHAWKKGHEVMRSRTFAASTEDELLALLRECAVEYAHTYLAEREPPLALTPAENARFLLIYTRIFLKGVFDASAEASS
ncbi:MAG TPA: hypothetical protein VH540_03130 [Ktedonobacterales bacterium]|jgi:hypothetical protein